MTAVQTLTVAADEADIRLDRWFKRHFPQVSHGRLEKLLRTGQVRVDGGRAKSNDRLSAGQMIRVPPLPAEAESGPLPDRPVDATLAADLRKRVLYRDDLVIALDKPAGLAVQGGSGQSRHVDGALDELRFGHNERPRLVHRLDKDTSGVLLLARTASAASALSEAFRHRSTRKLYWALTVGVPEPAEGKIDKPLAKITAEQGERVAVDEDDGKYAITRYAVLDAAGRKAAWLALMPLTGRTHQLRVHMAMLGTPIVGDRKYGGDAAYLHGAVNKKLHLHARRLVIPHPSGRGQVDVTAPLPAHMKETWALLGLDPADRRDPFAED